MDSTPTTTAKATVPWGAHAPELARWTCRLLVNRRDVHGRYWAGGPFTAPRKDRRGLVLLTEADVVRHFRATCRADVLGLHTTSPDNRSRWGLLDIDQHGEDGRRAEANLRAALAWYAQLVRLGSTPLLTTSNGKGGYHLRVIFNESVPTPRVFGLVRWLARDHKAHGLEAPPEVFPKQPAIKPERYGNWARLPGKHYKHEHWSEVWDGSRWLSGADAVAFILALEGDVPALIPAESVTFATPPAPPQRQAAGPRARAQGKGSSAGRIVAYLDTLPNLAEGQGRDDVAFRFACFLVRDLQLGDEQALSWLTRWDGKNRPPKGEDRLRLILKSAHEYGSRPYGAGLKGRVCELPGGARIVRRRGGRLVVRVSCLACQDSAAGRASP